RLVPRPAAPTHGFSRIRLWSWTQQLTTPRQLLASDPETILATPKGGCPSRVHLRLALPFQTKLRSLRVCKRVHRCCESGHSSSRSAEFDALAMLPATRPLRFDRARPVDSEATRPRHLCKERQHPRRCRQAQIRATFAGRP